MIKTENDYPKEDVLYLSSEVLDCAELFMRAADIDEQYIIRSRDFIRRNNLMNLSINKLKNSTINPSSRPELIGLKIIKELFCSANNPVLIRTPKQTVLSFWNYNLEFQNDYCTKIESCLYFEDYQHIEYSEITFQYSNDVLVHSFKSRILIENCTAPQYMDERDTKIFIQKIKEVIKDKNEKYVQYIINLYYNYEESKDDKELISCSAVYGSNIKTDNSLAHKVYKRTSDENIYTKENAPYYVNWHNSKTGSMLIAKNIFGDYLSITSHWEHKDGCKFLFSKVNEKQLLEAMLFDSRGNIIEHFTPSRTITYSYQYLADNKTLKSVLMSFTPSINARPELRILFSI